MTKNNQKSHKKKLFTAFTLAEVLIVLGIIGVVASLTIPVLTQKYKKHVIETKLKQNYSLFKNALLMAQAEKGDPSNWGLAPTNINSTGWMLTFFNDYIFKYLKVVEKGRLSLAELGYKTPIYSPNGTVAKELDSVATRYKLSNGSIVVTIGYNHNNESSTALFIEVDLNGTAKPNTYGKDIFKYVTTLDSSHIGFDLINYNFTYDQNTHKYTYTTFNHNELINNCLNNDAGTYCGALIVQNGWKIPKDYPLKF